jgi:hypothetical protein
MTHVPTIIVATAACIAAAAPAAGIAAIAPHPEDVKSCTATEDELTRITGVPSLVCTSTAGTFARRAAQSSTVSAGILLGGTGKVGTPINAPVRYKREMSVLQKYMWVIWALRTSQPILLSRNERSSADPVEVLRGTPVYVSQASWRDVTEANQPALPGAFDVHGHYIGPRLSTQLGSYAPILEARSRRIFTGSHQESARQRWMAEQEQRMIENEINRSKPLLYPVNSH